MVSAESFTQTSIRFDAERPDALLLSPDMSKPLPTRDTLTCLMGLAQAGDKLAYGRLLRQLLPILRSYVRHQSAGRSPNDIEDIVQDILLTLHAVRATYDPAKSALPWVFGIAAHRIAEARRRAARLYLRELLVETLPETHAVANASAGTNGYGDVEALHQAIAKLPPIQKVAIQLVKLREMTLTEASEFSGMSTAALKAAVHRGMASLRDRLDDAHG